MLSASWVPLVKVGVFKLAPWVVCCIGSGLYGFSSEEVLGGIRRMSDLQFRGRAFELRMILLLWLRSVTEIAALNHSLYHFGTHGR
jgi:hypothetical protein